MMVGQGQKGLMVYITIRATTHNLVGGVGGRVEETASVLTLATGKTDVARLTPGGAPGVLDEPVVLARVRSVTGGEDTVVELLTAGRGGEDATSVEGPVGGVNGDRDGLLGNGRHEGVGRLVDVLVARDRGNVLARGLLARAVLGSVRVGSPRADATVLDDPRETVVHEATVAPVVTGVAVDELLGRQRVQALARDGHKTLNTGTGRESPARTALALVLDVSHGTLGDPVDRRGEVDNRPREGVHAARLGSLRGLEVQVVSLELVLGQVSKLSHTHGERLLASGKLGVVAVDLVNVVLEDQELHTFTFIVSRHRPQHKGGGEEKKRSEKSFVVATDNFKGKEEKKKARGEKRGKGKGDRKKDHWYPSHIDPTSGKKSL